ncbi:hypothetical protein GJ496_010269 [Pomphorhynchus laevis]|nr:hypothetical protein GJ496_010269 [Pomphorhynchus laevis]
MWSRILLTPSAYGCSRCYCHGVSYGLHALTCQFGCFGGFRHDAIRDEFFRSALRTTTHMGLEMRHLLPNLQERSVDILLNRDPPEAEDFAVTNLHNRLTHRWPQQSEVRQHMLTQKVLNDVSIKVRVACRLQLQSSNSRELWRMDDRGKALVFKIATFEICIVGTHYSIAATRIFQEASVALMRGNARAILTSLKNSEVAVAIVAIVSPPVPHMFT